nr:hypothetical protein GCM10020063_034260 [Dactylosporangium thailandense]
MLAIDDKGKFCKNLPLAEGGGIVGRVMQAARRELGRVRASPAAWQELRYERSTDAHAATRAMVLWASQYDRRPGDLPLVRWPAEQEAPFQLGSGASDRSAYAGLRPSCWRR